MIPSFKFYRWIDKSETRNMIQKKENFEDFSFQPALKDCVVTGSFGIENELTIAKRSSY